MRLSSTLALMSMSISLESVRNERCRLDGSTRSTVARRPSAKTKDRGFRVCRVWFGALAVALDVSACDVGTVPVPTPHTLPRPADYVKGFPSQSDDPTVLALAVIMDEASRVEALLGSGADPNARWGGRGNRFPLIDAIVAQSYGYPSRSRDTIVRALLAHGADPNARVLSVRDTPADHSHEPWMHQRSRVHAAHGCGGARPVERRLSPA